MAERDEEVKFGLTSTVFEAGVERIIKSMTKMEMATEKTAKAMGKALDKSFKPVGQQVPKLKVQTEGFFKGATKVAAGLTAAVGVLTAGFFAFRAVLSKIPEIGQTFSIFKDIFLKNLLFPLRKLLIPELQKLLNFARTHRTLFVRWGEALVKVFKIVSTGVKVAVSLLRTFFRSFSGTLERISGVTTRSVLDLVNIVAFKLTALLIFLEITLKPIFDIIGTAIAVVTGQLIDFFGGFLDGASKVTGLGAAFSDLKTAIIGFFSAIDKKLPIIRKIGEIFGTFLAARIRETVDAITLLVNILTKLVGLVPALFDKLGELDKKFLGGFVGRIFGKGGEIGEKVLKTVRETRFIKTAGDPLLGALDKVRESLEGRPNQDLTPLPSVGRGGGGGKDINMTVGDISVTVTEGNATQAGINVADGLLGRLGQAVRDDLNDDKAATGGIP